MTKHCSFVLVLLMGGSIAQSAPDYTAMDYGPFLSASIRATWPEGNLVLKGIAIKVSSDAVQGCVLFDTELCRYAAASTGGFLNLQGVVYPPRQKLGEIYAENQMAALPQLAGEQWLGTEAAPGVAKGDSFKDPREIPHGPLPRRWARYKGLYVHEEGVVLSYSAGAASLLDMPGLEVIDGVVILTRTVLARRLEEPVQLLICDVEGAGSPSQLPDGILGLDTRGHTTWARCVGGGAGSGARLNAARAGRLVLELPASSRDVLVKVSVARVATQRTAGAVAALRNSPPARDPNSFTRGGKPRWVERPITRGKRGADDAAYVIDTIRVPFENPYNAWFRFGGLDFFSDGRAALSTWSGDVWIVSGLDDDLERVEWKRFATGLFQPLGLKIVDDTVYALCRDQIVRLHDLNQSGEADFYESFNNDIMITHNFHEFALDLHTDSEGNFYFAKGGPRSAVGRFWDKILPHHGRLFKVSKDGSRLEVIAHGFRAPNGMCVGPNNEITTSDNEGRWTPTTPINWIEKGGFYGVADFVHPRPARRDPPLCWIPHTVDSSAGGQVWVHGDRFGPLSGQLLHMSFGKCALFLVLKEKVAGVMQGGVVPLGLGFESGICRGRFRAEQNSVYLAGLRGWQTSAAFDACFQRVRYTERPFHFPAGLHFWKRGIAITFTRPLDPHSSLESRRYTLRQWNYRWTTEYGSPHFKVSRLDEQGFDPIEVLAVKLSEDAKTVFLETQELKPVDQIHIRFRLQTADGTRIRHSIYGTINALEDQ